MENIANKKRISRKPFAVILICLLICGFSSTVFAGALMADYAKKLVLEFGGTAGSGAEWYYLNMGSRLNGATKVTASSSKTKVVETSVYEYNKNFSVQLQTKGAGTSNVTIKVKKAGKETAYKIKVTVRKYANPAKKFKVGSKSYTSGFKKVFQYRNVKFPTKKAKIAIKANTNWKINKIVVNCSGGTNISKVVKNNSVFDFSTLKGTNKSIEVSFTNTKTKLSTTLYLTSY